MRRSATCGLVLLILLVAPNSTAECFPERQDGVVCDTHCIVWGEFGGYCNTNVPSEPERGCGQLMDGCMSMDNVPCCQSEPLF